MSGFLTRRRTLLKGEGRSNGENELHSDCMDLVEAVRRGHTFTQDWRLVGD